MIRTVKAPWWSRRASWTSLSERMGGWIAVRTTAVIAVVGRERGPTGGEKAVRKNDGRSARAAGRSRGEIPLSTPVYRVDWPTESTLVYSVGRPRSSALSTVVDSLRVGLPSTRATR